MKPNCWEFKKCGRQRGGPRVASLGVCKAATEAALDGVHGGRNAGRACWVVAGTLCKGEVQGSFAQKFKGCEQCDFYLHVREDEAGAFVLSGTLLRRLRA